MHRMQRARQGLSCIVLRSHCPTLLLLLLLLALLLLLLVVLPAVHRQQEHHRCRRRRGRGRNARTARRQIRKAAHPGKGTQHSSWSVRVGGGREEEGMRKIEEGFRLATRRSGEGGCSQWGGRLESKAKKGDYYSLSLHFSLGKATEGAKLGS
jgi:hypothetical protein